MKRVIAFLPLIGLVALGLMFLVSSLQRDPNVKPDALVGRSLPRLILPGLDGPPEPLAAGLGGAGYVNIFASWCAPCEFEHPQLMRLRQAGVPVVGIAYKDDPDKTRAFLQRLGDPFTDVRVDRDGQAGIELGISGVPETFLVGADGQVIAKFSGPLTPEHLADLEAKRRAAR